MFSPLPMPPMSFCYVYCENVNWCRLRAFGKQTRHLQTMVRIRARVQNYYQVHLKISLDQGLKSGKTNRTDSWP